MGVDRGATTAVTTFAAYGLVFASEIPLALPLASADADVADEVRILRGPWDPDDSLPQVDLITHASPTRCLLDLSTPIGVRYDVRDGNTIIVDADDDADLGDLWLWLLGPVLSSLLYQRDILPLHANAVVMPDGRAVAVAGDSGAGKSTLTAALLARGARMLTDDITAVDTSGGVPTVTGGIQRLKLWDTSAALLDLDLSDVPMVRPDLPKHALDVADRAATGPAPLASLHVLTPRSSGDDLTIEALSGMARLGPLQTHLSRHRMMNAIADRATTFQRLASLARTVEVYAIHRRSDADTLRAITDHVVRTHG